LGATTHAPAAAGRNTRSVTGLKARPGDRAAQDSKSVRSAGQRSELRPEWRSPHPLHSEPHASSFRQPDAIFPSPILLPSRVKDASSQRARRPCSDSKRLPRGAIRKTSGMQRDLHGTAGGH
jgi:hypothetical protein